MDRSHTRFAEAVRNSFSFLGDDYDFQESEREDTFVRYESKLVFVNVYHGRVSYEVGLEIGLRGLHRTGYSLKTLLQVMKCPGAGDFRIKIADRPEDVAKCVSELAMLLRTYGQLALHGDDDVFERLRLAVEHYWDEQQAAMVRVEAAEAFRNKDYATAAELYGSILKSLKPSEKGKLRYAENKAN